MRTRLWIILTAGFLTLTALTLMASAYLVGQDKFALEVTPDAMATRLAVLDTRIVELEAMGVQLHGTAVALETQCAMTPTPVSALCRPCGADFDCPSGYFCNYCPSVGKRCVRKTSPNADCQQCLTLAGPILIGIATHYDPPWHEGRQTKSGQVYDEEAMACAVPQELWDELRGKMLRVVHGGREVRVVVNDTGRLTEAGRFQWTKQLIDGHWVEWFHPAISGYNIVVDLTPTAYYLLDPQGLVQVYLEE